MTEPRNIIRNWEHFRAFTFTSWVNHKDLNQTTHLKTSKLTYPATSNDCAFCNLVFDCGPGPDLLKEELFGNVAAVKINKCWIILILQRWETFPYLQKLKRIVIKSVAKLFCLPSHPGLKKRVIPFLLPKMSLDLLVPTQSHLPK